MELQESSHRIKQNEMSTVSVEYSMVLMVTGASWRLSVHASSHGAGHTRPVNSGKLLVEWSTSRASRHRSR